MSQSNDRVFYAVGLGRERGIFNSWRECKVQVEGISNAKFKKFFTYEEAQEFINFWKNHPSTETDSMNFRVSRKGGSRGINGGDRQRDIPPGRTASTRLTKAGASWNCNRLNKNTPKKKDNFILGALNGIPSNTGHQTRNFTLSYVSPINQTQDTFKAPIKVETDSTSETSNDIQTLNVVKVENSFDEDSGEVIREAPSLPTVSSGQAKSQSKKASGESTVPQQGFKSVQKLTELPNVRKIQDKGEGVPVEAFPPGSQTPEGSQRERGSDIRRNEEKGNETLQKCLQLLSSALRLLSKEKLQNSTGTLNSLRHFPKQLTGSTNGHVHPQVNTEEGNSQRGGGGARGGGVGEEFSGDKEEPMEGLEGQSMSSRSPPKSSSSSFLLSSPFSSRQETTNVEVAALNLRLDAFEKRFDLCLKEVGGIFSELTHIKEEIKDVKESIRKAVAAGLGPPDPKNFGALSRDSHRENGNSSLDIREPTTSRLSGDSEGEPATKRPKFLKTVQPKTKFEEDDNIDLVKVKTENAHLATFTVDSDDYVQVYTDGACIDNGKKCAKAGIGIYFGDDHPMNTSARAKGPQTNNNAEIQAARVAIELAIEAGLDKVRILTDSEFLINCVTKWMHKWKRNGWSVVDGGEVKNRKELEKLDWFASKISVRWQKVEAHKGIKGNEEADRLAREGASKSAG